MDHQDVIELIPAFALNALSSHERHTVQTHLQGCAECQAALRAYEDTLDLLVLASPSYEPPADLKQSILLKAVPHGTPTSPRQLFNWRGFFTRLKPLVTVWGMASLFLVVVLIMNNIMLQQRLDRLETSKAFQVVALVGSDNAPEASGLLVISSDGMAGSLVVEHLPVLETGSQYQLWLIRDGERTSGGVFSVDQDGYAVMQLDSETSLRIFDAFGVTIEPQGGSPGPTGKKVLGGEL